MLQFITDPKAATPVEDQIKQFIAGGGRWVQISMPEASDEEIGKVVESVKPLCIETETFLILDSRVDLAKKLDVGGVFLHKGDELPSKARLTLGPAAVIGVEAHDIDDVKAVKSLDIDYIAFMPFAGKQDALGVEGVRALDIEMQRLEINISHVAAGGIGMDDVVPLLETGVNGIAMSGAIATSGDIKASTEKVIAMLGRD